MILTLKQRDLECAKDHMEIDEGYLSLGKWAIEELSESLLKPKQTSCLETLHARMLLIAQSSACAVVLPFKLLLTFCLCLNAMFNPKDPCAWISAGYSLLSVGVYAMVIPATAALAFMPLDAINALKRQVNVARRVAGVENDPIRLFEHYFGPIPPQFRNRFAGRFSFA